MSRWNHPGEEGLAGGEGRICDQFAVMLHLRSRYVSKAAILTMSALSVSVENRSPA
jgi:hypothetical protein